MSRPDFLDWGAIFQDIAITPICGIIPRGEEWGRFVTENAVSIQGVFDKNLVWRLFHWLSYYTRANFKG